MSRYKCIFKILFHSFASVIQLDHAISTLELRYFGQETIGQLHKNACEIFDLQLDQVMTSHSFSDF